MSHEPTAMSDGSIQQQVIQLRSCANWNRERAEECERGGHLADARRLRNQVNELELKIRSLSRFADSAARSEHDGRVIDREIAL
jgi:hypothetical protein